MNGFDIDELLLKFRYPLLTLLIGLILTGIGIFYGLNFGKTKVEIISDTAGSPTDEITAEISGAVTTPGVYKVKSGARIEDLLILSGGFSGDADRLWTDKYLNRAAKITDGQKVYIPKIDEQSGGPSAKSSGGDQTISSTFSSDSNSLVNINTASLSQLDSLPGIGPVYGQNIIDHRPYSNLDELVSKGVIKQNLYEKIKDKITIY